MNFIAITYIWFRVFRSGKSTQMNGIKVLINFLIIRISSLFRTESINLCSFSSKKKDTIENVECNMQKYKRQNQHFSFWGTHIKSNDVPECVFEFAESVTFVSNDKMHVLDEHMQHKLNLEQETKVLSHEIAIFLNSSNLIEVWRYKHTQRI